MRGLITTSDVLLHPLIIVAAFGLRVYARCLVRLVGVRVIKTLRNSHSTEGHADHHAVRRA